MRVCLISKQFDPTGGGSERYAYVLALALADRGHDVDVFALGDRSSLPESTRHERLSVTFLSDRRRPLVTFETLYHSLLARKTVDFGSYDVIHGTLMPASTIALTVAPPETPIVVTCHSISLREVQTHKLEVPTDVLRKFVFHPTNVLMDAVASVRTSKTIAISSVVQRDLDRYYPPDSSDTVRIPHGVDSDRFRPDHPPHPAPSHDRFTLLHVGRLVSRKHVELGIEALAATERDDVELLIAGTGHHRDRLERRARELGVDADTEFLGFVPEDRLPSLYATSDAFLFLPRFEGFGLTFLEAMASGTPVIGTETGGLPDLVTDGEDGLFVDDDPVDVGRAVDRLAGTPSLLDEMAGNARETAASRTWDTVAAETERVYEAALE
ncbi:glycosyltransferase family 4 protein [Halosimplex salinum]|uniref:glycosyltransferase family 4 protein n=1 Tax=Halosimplex salinum TaxID=1710538 RepID=UPI000F49C795|nr:glycosyltransferase family 4 protein [Halosimplex salinum]